MNGVAIEETEHGGRLVVTRIGPRSLLWRLERAGPAAPAIPSFGNAGFPWLRIDAEGRVLEQNAAAAAMAEGRADLDEILADGPLRPDGVHVLAATGQAVRAVAFPGGDGWRDLLLMPLNGAEISGLVPDHFLEELPVALARLETGGRLTYANKAARQLARRPRPAGRRHRRPDRGARPADRRAAGRHREGPGARPVRDRAADRRRAGGLPPGRLHPHRARRRLVAPRRRLGRDRAQDAGGAVRAEPEDAGGGAACRAAWRTTSTTS